MKVHVPGPNCDDCMAAIDDAFNAPDPDERVEMDLDPMTLTLESGKNANNLRAALNAAGYPASPV